MGMNVEKTTLSQRRAEIQDVLDAKKSTRAYDISIFEDDILTYGTDKQKATYKELLKADEAYRAEKNARRAKIGENMGAKSGVVKADERAAQEIWKNKLHNVKQENVYDELAKEYRAEKDARWAKIGENMGEKSGVVKADERAAQEIWKNNLYNAKQENVYDELAKEYRAEKDARRARIAENKGKKSGVIEAERRAAEILDTNKKDKNFLNKLGNFLKNNKKTFALGAGVLAAAGLAAWLLNKDDKMVDEAQVQAIDKNNATVADSSATDIKNVVPGVVADSSATVSGVVPGVVADSSATVPGVVPGVVADSSATVPGVVPGVEDEKKADETPTAEDTKDANETKKAQEAEEAKKADETPTAEDTKDANEIKKAQEAEEAKKAENKNKEYVIKKGDNVWNIAKRQLTEELGRKPYNREIAVRTKEIMKKNNLKYEADNYTVLIYPQEKLNLDVAS